MGNAFSCQRITCCTAVTDGLCRQRCDIPHGGWCVTFLQTMLGITHQTGSRACQLQAVIFAAVAGVRAIGQHRNMSDFSCAAQNAGNNFAILNDTAADTGSQRQQNQALIAAACTLPLFAQCRNVCVIGGIYRQICEGSQLLGNIHNSPAQIDTAIDRAILQNRTRHADANTGNICMLDLMLLLCSLNCSGNITQNIDTTVFRSGFDFPFVQPAGGLVIQAKLYRCAAHINAKIILLHHPSPLSVESIQIYHITKRLHSQSFSAFFRAMVR